MRTRILFGCVVVSLSAFAGASAVGAGDDSAEPRARQLVKLDARVFADDEKAKQLARMHRDEVLGRLHAANQRQAKAFDQVQTRAEWERFRDVRLKALRDSLGQYPPVPRDLKVRVVQTHRGDGYQIENLVFESRPGLVVTASLYSPTKPAKAMPGLLVCHSFFHGKYQAELQDMGVNWARQGCVVLVPDLLGHSERRQHPFVDAKSYPHKFNLPRQDYYFRANVGSQLYLIGDSLMGWMVWDVLRGVDLLLGRPGVDKDRIILLGAVAAGADPAAVAAALDPRVAAVVPFNFGGPEPETPYPLPADPEKVYPYASGHWDSTRRLRLSARDGFVPWVIAGSVAPRRLVYAHEFAWDRDKDPVWPRLQKMFDLAGARDHLAFAHGYGTLFGKPEGSGCGNIGAVHRQELYPTFQRWFGMPAPAKEVQERRPPTDFLCLTPEVVAAYKPRTVAELAAELGAERAAAARRVLPEKADARRAQLRRDWARLLGDVEPASDLKATTHGKQEFNGLAVERISLQVAPGIVVPMLLLVPPRKGDARLPVVVAVAQQGKAEFLKQRSEALAALVNGGAAVCLPDVRGTGETRPAGDLRGPPAGFYKGVESRSVGTFLACEELMLGQTVLGSRLRDLRSVLRYLRTRPDLDAGRLALWGDSFASVNSPDDNLHVPWDAEKLPAQAEPLGGLLALFGALFEDEVRAVSIRGGLAGYHTLLPSQFLFVPHEALVPGALTAGDLSDVAGALAPRPLRLEGLVDGLNRRVPAESLAKTLEPARTPYQRAGADQRLQVEVTVSPDAKLAAWLLQQVR